MSNAKNKVVDDAKKLSAPKTAEASPVDSANDAAGADSPFEHLDPRLKELMRAPLAARIRHALADVMIVHPHLVGLLNEVEWLIREPERQRARGLVICGDPGSGKTAISELVQKTYPIDRPGTPDNDKRPRVVAISMSGARKTKDVLNRVLAATGAPISRRYTTGDHELLVQETLRRMQCRLLVLDECQDILQIAEREQLRVLETTKYLMNSLRLPVLALGTDPARMAFRADPHLQARFEVLEIPRWEEGDDFAALLDCLERCLPLKHPSNLSDPKMQKVLIKVTGGVLDKILSRIRLAAVNALVDLTERVTREAIANGGARPAADVLGPK